MAACDEGQSVVEDVTNFRSHVDDTAKLIEGFKKQTTAQIKKEKSELMSARMDVLYREAKALLASARAEADEAHKDVGTKLEQEHAIIVGQKRKKALRSKIQADIKDLALAVSVAIRDAKTPSADKAFAAFQFQQALNEKSKMLLKNEMLLEFGVDRKFEEFSKAKIAEHNILEIATEVAAVLKAANTHLKKALKG